MEVERIIYKDRPVEVEKIVEVEKLVYRDQVRGSPKTEMLGDGYGDGYAIDFIDSGEREEEEESLLRYEEEARIHQVFLVCC